MILTCYGTNKLNLVIINGWAKINLIILHIDWLMIDYANLQLDESYIRTK